MNATDRYATYPSLRGAGVVVSGGATGLGAQFVTEFAAQGARVGFVDVQEDAGRALVEAVAAAGHPRPEFRRADVRDLAGYQEVLRGLAADLGSVGVLVNNAADDTRHASTGVDPAAWDAGFRVNLDHQFFAVQALAPALRAAGGGSVVNLGSISTHVKLRDLVVYRTAKAAVEGLTRALAIELGADAVRVNCVIPGWVMTARQLEHHVDAEAEATLDREQALARRVQPADVARLVLWLAAEDSAACTGQNWIVDGGWM
ncbi:SDR family NAD(P)-dependent oxidoreductase [Kineococcus rhizosphaerae]|uniref:NAD(P)-dependent dehydrogenase (Short-subunit alcohol dehydrogenase family) n=1 Tax=Kineococcus rhizosphaerae TaxID=559628 RepID=A0A2T0R7L3_9ACTN|nr:SDR family oxidoreductase [Kineococcus rhizosphaerae]PRY17156.1 NAD(P)-dependent dehydrogenase (short-subunit alcohol dehydrogenase family) [Kineococcus rhizosphaerae]